MPPRHHATRYLVPLREGGSLPAVVDTAEDGLFVTKFRGAGQGSRALVAELLVGALAARLDLPVPEMALIELDEAFGRTERDPEIQDILRGSEGLNVGHRYLEGAIMHDAAHGDVAPDLAARIVWLDALVTNPDRTARNPNLLWWRQELWIIDHGAALYFHHAWDPSWLDAWKETGRKRARDPFAPIIDHVLLAQAEDLAAIDEQLAAALPPSALDGIVEDLPDELLMDAPSGLTPAFPTADEHRHAYRRYLADRLEAPRPFVGAAVEAQTELSTRPRRPSSYRR